MKFFIALLLIFSTAGCSPKQNQVAAAPAELPVLTITNESVSTSQEFPAAIEGIVNIEIRPQVSGTIKQVMVDEGAFVTAGQPLFRIDEQPFLATLGNAQASLQAAEAVLENASIEVEKLTPLVQNKVVAEYQLKTAKATAAIASANIDNAKATIETARINLGYTNIKAPVSGFIGRLPRKFGSLVSPADPTPLAELSDVHQVHVYFSLSEYDFIRFKDHYTGQTLAAKIKELPPVELLLADDSLYPVKGKIDMIDGQFNKNTAAITLRAVFPNSDGLLRSGNTGRIRLASKYTEAVTVPQAATLEIQDKVFVFLLGPDNRVSRQQLIVAGKSGNNYLVKSGIKPGDRIVFTGFDHLNEGELITPGKITAPVVKN